MMIPNSEGGRMLLVRLVCKGERFGLNDVLVHGAQREARGKGWRPSVTRNGKETWGAWGRGLDRDEAERVAALDAQEQASHYIGDWTVRIERRIDA